MSPEAARRPDGARCSGTPDRERLVALLPEHYAAGRLDLDDLRHPVGIVLAAACAEETAVVLADLPPAGVPDTPGAAGVKPIGSGFDPLSPRSSGRAHRGRAG